MPPEGRPGRRILMLVHSYYEEDPRVRREAESLVAAGESVDVLALRQPGANAEGVVDGVRVRRLDVQRHQGAGLGTYAREYLSFIVRAGWAAVRLHRARRYHLVQVHSLPDALVFAALPLRLAGVPILLDLHEAMPEFFRSRFPRASNPIVHRLLLLQERLSIGAATRVLTVNDALRERLVALGVPGDKVAVVRNGPSLRRFDPAAHPRRAFMEDGCLRLVYAGALTPTYELDVLIDAVAGLAGARPDLPIRLDLYGRGDSEGRLRERVAARSLDGIVEFHGRIPVEAVPAAIAAADIGVAPTRRDRFTDISLSTKIFEYAAMGKPAVCSRLPLVESLLPEAMATAYPAGDAVALAGVLARLVDDPDGRRDAIRAMGAAVARVAWDAEVTRYLVIVDELIGP